MNRSAMTESQSRRSLWNDTCGAVVFLSFLVIVAHVASPPLFGLAIPYAGGAAVVLGLGATLCLWLRSRSTRLAVASGLVALLALRALSALRPDLLIAKHGALSLLDGTVLLLLGLAGAALIVVATRRDSTEPNKPLQPSGIARG